MINLKFKIKNSKPNRSEIYLSESYISQNSNKDYAEIILNQINMANISFKKNPDIKSAWFNLMNFINTNKFYFYKTLALKKGTPKLEKWLNNKDRPLENICIIIHDNNLKINNSICFFIDVENNNESYDDYLLKRIEFFNWGLQTKDGTKVKLDEIKHIEFDYTNIERKLLFDYQMIFENDDYQADPLFFKEWTSYLQHLSKHFNDKKDLECNNYIINIKNENLIISKNKINIRRDKYIIFHNEIGQEIKNENTQISNDKEINLIEDISNYIDEYEIKIEKFHNDNNKLLQKINIKEFDLQKLNQDNLDLKIKIDNKKAILNSLQLEIKESKNKDNDRYKEFIFIKDDLKKLEDEIEIINIKSKNINSEIERLKIDIAENDKEKLECDKWIKIYKEFTEFCDKNFIKFFYVLKINQVNDNEIIFPKLDDNNWKIYSFKNNDFGTKAIINRFNNAFKNIEKGYYKNPFFYLSLKNTTSSFNNTEFLNQIDNLIERKYQLNNKQLNAVRKAINTNSFFYLQGPPGTGKTQTISAIAEWIINNNMNLIMTSSTHEAIENFFDRISQSNDDNPNLVALKFRTNLNNEINDEKYSENKLFKIFKSRMINYFLPKKNNEISLEDLLSNYIKKYGTDTPEEYRNSLPKTIVEIIFNTKDNESTSNFIEQFKIPNDHETFIKPIFNREQIDEPLRKLMNDKIDKNEELVNFEKLLDEFFKWTKSVNLDLNNIIFNINGEMQYIKVIQKIIEDSFNCKNYDTLDKILVAIKNRYTNLNIIDSYENVWLQYIVKNQLINIIGTTTTSKNEIKIANNDINLYSEYPIDYMIIDEISKCSMPEIFYRAILAKKIIFAGDYLQLPPSPNLDGENIINYLVESKYKDEFHNTNDIINELNIQKQYKYWIADLYKKSFFTIQTKNIKYINNNNNPLYEFLNEAHRFGKNILSIVNKIYPRDEQLILPFNLNKKTKKYNFIVGKNNFNNEVVLVNLKKCSKKFLNSHTDFIRLDDENGFDQSGSSYKHNNDYKKIVNEGSYNQYSAFIICDILEKLLEKNDLQNNKIAVITLTKNQKEMVNFYIKMRNIKSNKIIVNTIDNFQGREEEIVIVDFIRGKTKIENANKINNGKRNIDFLNQKERINVALSRAKQKLIIVGHFEYLRYLDIEDRLFQKYYEELSPQYNGSSNSYIDWSYENDEN